jgi:chorismate dehydratase
MVFAVWAARRDFAEAHPGAVKDVHDAFVRSLDLSLANVAEVAAQAARWEPLTARDLETYFTTLDFRLGERQLAGLREFARRAAPRGDWPPDVEVRFAQV